MYCCYYQSPIGKLTIMGSDEEICGIWLEKQKHFPATLPEYVLPTEKPRSLFLACRWLDAYFSREKPDASAVSLRPQGSTFQLSVWKHLCNIPYGHTITYGQLANIIASELGVAKMSAQAIGGAVGRNPISILIPCHRVVGAHGQLTGYAGGITNKQWLLEHECLCKNQSG